jgi:outer membrane protein assembly factor BamB
MDARLVDHRIARVCRYSYVVGRAALLAILFLTVTYVAAQPPVGEFSPELLNPRVARPAGAAVRLLERLEIFAEHENWDQLSATADELLTASVDGWVAQSQDHYVGLREAVNRQLAALPPEGLAAYRARVDPLAEARLAEGIAKRNEHMLRQVANESFCSSAGDDALWALGDIALERGDYQAARDAWQRLLPSKRGDAQLTYPDSSIPAADVSARLALVSLRENDFDRAQREIAALETEHPDAKGRLGGREVVHAERLRELLAQGPTRPPASSETARLAELRFSVAATVDLVRSANDDSPLPVATVFPTVANDWILFQDAAGVHAIRLDDDKLQARRLYASTQPLAVATSPPVVSGRTAFAVVPVRSESRDNTVANKLVALDLSRDGAMLFQQAPAEENAIFTGPPLASGPLVVACELSPQQGMKASVAAFDAWTGAPQWRRSLGFAFDPSLMAGAPTLGIAMASADGVLYVSTQLGMVAAFRLGDGEPLWLHTYPRTFPSGEAAVIVNRWRRPNPPWVSGSRVFVAADDSDSITALDAGSGATLWTTPLPTAEARILAVDGDRIIVTGDRLWAINAETGKLDPSWGEQLTGGAGQGALADDVIVWPTALSITLVDRTSGNPMDQSVALSSPGGANVAILGSAESSPTSAAVVIAATPTQLMLFRGAIPGADTE